MSETGTRAAIYARISKKEKDRDGRRAPEKVRDQTAACRVLAERLGLDVVGVYVDDGVSATSGVRRPGWEQLLADVNAGRFDVLLAVEESRFHRNLEDHQRLVIACLAHGVSWHTARDGIVDLTTAGGEFLSSIRAVVNRLEVRRKAERQAAATAARRGRGEPVGGGRRPFGYEPDRRRLRQPEATELGWAYSFLADGGKLWAVLRRWNIEQPIPTSTGGTWSYSSLQRVLLRAHNAGLYAGAVEGRPLEGYVGRWETVTDPDTWHAVARLLTDPSRSVTPDKAPRWLLSGIARCACGATMRGGRMTSHGRPVGLYRCNLTRSSGRPGPHTTARTDVLDDMVREEVVSAVLHGAGAMGPEGVAGGTAAHLRRLEDGLREVRRSRDALVELAGEPGWDGARLRGRMAELVALEEAQEADLAALRANDAHAAMLAGLTQELWAGRPTPPPVLAADLTVAETEAALATGVHTLPGSADSSRPRISLADAAALRQQLGERFDSLELHQRQVLVRALLVVTVRPRGADDRLVIERRDPYRLSAVQAEQPEVLSYP